MPALNAYTQYETFAFCQSVAYHGAETDAFDDISSALNANQVIRDSQSYDGTRLTAAALKSLYEDLLAEEREALPRPSINGDATTNGTNPRKRKLSGLPTPSDDVRSDEQGLLQSLVDKLYARLREDLFKEIREEEEHYLRLEAEIAELERAEVDTSRHQSIKDEVGGLPLQPSSAKQLQPISPVKRPEAASLSPTALTNGRTEPVLVAEPASTTKTKKSPPQLRPNIFPSVPLSKSPRSVASHLPPTRASIEPITTRTSQPSPAPVQPLQHSPGSFQRPHPAPPSQRQNYGPGSPQLLPPSHGQPYPIPPPHTGSPQMPPPAEYPQKRGSASAAQGNRSPIPGQLPPPPYPGYTGYPQQPPWPHHMPPHPQYGQPAPYPTQPYYVQSPPGRPAIPYQTPQHAPYMPYPQSAPINYQGHPPPPHTAQSWQQQTGHPHHSYQGTPTTTPVPRTGSRLSVHRSRSSTPWKRRTQLPNGVRPLSPTRPERDVSPISDAESSIRDTATGDSPGKTGKKEDAFVHHSRPRRGRPRASATPSAVVASRSQSVASFTSDTAHETRKRGLGSQKIKAEPPSTPAPMPSDTEQQPQRTSARRGRPRDSTAASKSEANAQTLATTGKRKRSRGHDSATPPPLTHRQSSPPTSHPKEQPSLSFANDPAFVIVSRSFTKTCQLLLSEITSHRLAGIFAKPLSERDAPGYKELILRPQDLKGIKTAISKGGKAALAAIEAFEDKHGEDAAGEKSTAHSTATERALGNGVYLVTSEDDLVPPKAIVNSAQLEMELTRMFTNAVMFNPLPSTERGFGWALRLRRRGGDVAPARHTEDANDDQEASSSSESSSPSDAGGIIADTRDMYEDVMAMVRKWREVELERFGGQSGDNDATPNAGSWRSLHQHASSGHGSTNASLRHSESVEKDEDVPSTSVGTSTGTARKRRRVAD